MGHGCQVPGSGHPVTGIRALSILHHAYPRVRVFRRQVPGTGFQVLDTWHPGPGTDQRRGPNTEHRRPSLTTEKPAHRVCILYPASWRIVCGLRRRGCACKMSVSESHLWGRVASIGSWVPGNRKADHSILSCIMHTPCAGFSKTSAWYRVPGTWHLGPGTGSTPRAGYRRPSLATGKRAHRVCILHPYFNRALFF
jgi:hypothetical protein